MAPAWWPPSWRDRPLSCRAKVAYVTHVLSGSRAILGIDGTVVERHHGGAGGPSRFKDVLSGEAAMSRIVASLTDGEYSDIYTYRRDITTVVLLCRTITGATDGV